MRYTFLHSFRKFFSRITLSYFLIVATLFNSVAPAILGLTSIVHASESTQVNLRYIDSSNSFDLTISPTAENVSYGLYTKTVTKLDLAQGSGDPINSSFNRSILSGSQSGENVVVDKVERGILKTKVGSNDITAKYIVIDNAILKMVAEMDVDVLELSSSEESWLTEPNTYGDLKIGTTYHAPFNGDLSVTFTTLPSNPGTVTFNKVTLTEDQIKESKAVSADAYEITSNMADGTFTYTLTLPNPSKKTDVSVQYSEDGISFDPTTNIVFEPSKITISNLNHFTIFVVSGASTTATAITLVNILDPSWTATGSGGVWAEYWGPGQDDIEVSPGVTAVFDGREAGGHLP